MQSRNTGGAEVVGVKQKQRSPQDEGEKAAFEFRAGRGQEASEKCRADIRYCEAFAKHRQAASHQGSSSQLATSENPLFSDAFVFLCDVYDTSASTTPTRPPPAAAHLRPWPASVPNLILSPTITSKLPRFLQSPANGDRFKSLSVDRPPSAKNGSGEGSTKSGDAKTSLLDKAVRYPLDGDNAPDRSTEEIWLMGLGVDSGAEVTMRHAGTGNDSSAYNSGSGAAPRGRAAHSVAGSSASYASSYNSYAGTPSPPSSNTSSTKRKWWLSSGIGGTKGWTSDAGWDACCGRARACWRRRWEPALHFSCLPPFPQPSRTAHALRTCLISWFFDAPAPVGVHRTALAGKDVGMWFGPSAAAGTFRYVLTPPLLALYAKSFVFTLPRTIFAIRDEPPTWSGADDDEMLERISDPEEEVDFGVDDGEISTTSHATSSVSASTFSHTHAHHGFNSTMQSTFTSNNRNSGAHSEEMDMEEDSVAPVTPLPNARFDLRPPQHALTKGMGMGKGRERAVREADEGEEQEGDAGASAGTQRELSAPGVGGGGWRGWDGVDDAAKGARAKRDGVAASGGGECGCGCGRAAAAHGAGA
ncbi:hypothetical protein C8R45DRAFT_1218633 [Mycena sanguinolenta]|nr:hypothetical protein C8R45DRAFT_1218633 [Mycena sanguinolenta]